jgi:hemerythrin-like domain-containing protein
MKPRGPLMIEHRLIEKMLVIVRQKILEMKGAKKADPVFIDTVVDFVRTYADRTHHGKEEDILFKLLEKKEMSASDKAMRDELLREHKFGRSTVRDIVAARNDYMDGKPEALSVIIDRLSTLAKFYPEHILKEDKFFFPSTEKLLSQAEQDLLLKEFLEFDAKMIHEKYGLVVESFKTKS